MNTDKQKLIIRPWFAQYCMLQKLYSVKLIKQEGH